MKLKVRTVAKDDWFSHAQSVLNILFLIWVMNAKEYNVAFFKIFIPCLVFYLMIVLFLRQKRKIDLTVFELNNNLVYYNYDLRRRTSEIDLNRVLDIKYGDNVIVFEGEYPYTHEIFFPRKYHSKIDEIIKLLSARNMFKISKLA
ncbi:hypothetical protein [Endozoicomonas ascidiicola]|uniref:hypothetical protein n=1 Tax=Endozoicomonas ascidiicola TaxID=1698521 RepID=UPI0008337755|nr:hypothetical protein [Endozoicomonas ascidiicola]